MHDPAETIVAVATPPGRGGVGCVRLSGLDAETIARSLFTPARARRPTAIASAAPEMREQLEERFVAGHAQFGRFLGRSGEEIDHGYLIRFDRGRSFTGESTVELWTHGSPAVLGELVAAALEFGARAAGPGEFTYRALRNGRLDLASAEGVRDLIDAQTKAQARVAFAQAEGALSRALAPLREELEDLIARGEAAVEFVDESETHLTVSQLQTGIDRVADGCAGLLAQYRGGRLVREGATLAIVGKPNAGKSSLFNRLLTRERAIVTDTPGTTRDTLEEVIDLDGIPLRLVDTAGLRETADPIEQEGVRRAEAARAEADISLLVLDNARSIEADEEQALSEASVSGVGRTLVAVNKCDLPPKLRLPATALTTVRVSALNGEGLDRLRRELLGLLHDGPVLEDPLLTDARHADALGRCAASLKSAGDALRGGLTEEVALEDVRAAVAALGEITGEFGTEDLLGRIFSTFCIGK